MTELHYLLAIETSGETCGVALARGNEIWGEYSIFTPHHHDRLLAELTRRLLNDAGINVSSLSAVALSEGPGSFTGLRVGAAFVKALCLDFSDAPAPVLVAVPTLDAFACAAEEFAVSTNAESIFATTRSHRDLLYAKKFSADLKPLSEIELINNKRLDEIVGTRDIICGTAAAAASVGMRLSGLNRLTPRFTARLGVRLFAKGKYSDALNFTPAYSQDFIPKTANERQGS